MSHYAKIENNVVVQVIVAEQDFIDTLDGQWLQASYNTYGNQHLLGGTPLRKNFPSIGFRYNQELDAFIPPKPLYQDEYDPTKPLGTPVLDYETGLWEFNI